MILKLKNIYNTFCLFLSKIFTRSNFNKFIIIFVFGFITRILVCNFYNINVFSDYLNIVSVYYYLIFSCFVIFIHELVNYFDIDIIPSVINDLYILMFKLINNLAIYSSTTFRFVANIFITIYKDITSKISNVNKFLNNDAKHYLNNNMATLDVNLSENNHIKEVNKTNSNSLLYNYVLQKNSIESTNENMNTDQGSTTNYNGQNIGGSNSIASNINNTVEGNNTISTYTNSIINYDGQLYFVVNTIRDSGGERNLVTPVPNVGNHIPDAPSPSNLSTPSTNYSPLFPQNYSFTNVSAVPNPLFDQNAYNHNMPAAPIISNISTPSSNYSPLFPHNNEYTANNPLLNPYSNTNYTTMSNAQNSNHATIGLNGSNERMWLTPERNSLEWDQYRYIVKRNMEERMLEENKGFSDKIVLPNELEIKKKGVMGKIKLGFKFIDRKIENTVDNIDSIIVKYYESSKRKFVWTVWEKDSYNYESYEDFKNSWDPKTKIWDEIKKRTHRDIQKDVEGVLGISENKSLKHTTNMQLKPGESGITYEVNNLIEKTQPFSKQSNNFDPQEGPSNTTNNFDPQEGASNTNNNFDPQEGASDINNSSNQKSHRTRHHSSRHHHHHRRHHSGTRHHSSRQHSSTRHHSSSRHHSRNNSSDRSHSRSHSNNRSHSYKDKGKGKELNN